MPGRREEVDAGRRRRRGIRLCRRGRGEHGKLWVGVGFVELVGLKQLIERVFVGGGGFVGGRRLVGQQIRAAVDRGGARRMSVAVMGRVTPLLI